MKNGTKKKDVRVRCVACRSRYNPGNVVRRRRHEAHERVEVRKK